MPQRGWCERGNKLFLVARAENYLPATEVTVNSQQRRQRDRLLKPLLAQLVGHQFTAVIKQSPWLMKSVTKTTVIVVDVRWSGASQTQLDIEVLDSHGQQQTLEHAILFKGDGETVQCFSIKSGLVFSRADSQSV